MSLPTAAEDIGLDLGILLPAEGPAGVGQRKPQRQQQPEMLPFLFPETGILVHCSWLTSEHLLFLLIPTAGSCMTPISLQHVMCSFDWDRALSKALPHLCNKHTYSGLPVAACKALSPHSGP